MNISSHSVAVDHINDSLREFCDLYRKSKHLPSITQLVLTGIPSGVGKKGNRISRKRKHEPECTRVPLTASSAASVVYGIVSLESLPGPSHSSFSSPLFAQFMHWNTHQSDCMNTGLTEPLPGPTSFVPTDSVSLTPTMQWSTYQGDIHVQSPTQWNAPFSSYQQSPFPSRCANPEVFCLCFRTGNISVCSGCRNNLDKQAYPPNDLCVQHEEWHSYTSPVSKLPESQFGNAYYHANPYCILARWPRFSPGDLLVPEDIRSRLPPPPNTKHLSPLYLVCFSRSSMIVITVL